jgi:signal transduction histidine kinase/streptogramin lyase
MRRAQPWAYFCVAGILLFLPVMSSEVSSRAPRSHTAKKGDIADSADGRLLPPPPPPSFQGMTHTSWTRRDGAPGSISSLAQTKDGYLWIGSALGLYRFDGLHFSSYPFGPANPALPSLDVASLAADLNGGLWVVMRNATVIHLKADGSGDFYDRNNGLTMSTIDRILSLPDGTVWITGGSKLLRLEGNQWVDFGTPHGLSGKGVFSVFFDHEGSIWVGQDKQLCVLKKGDPQFTVVPVPVHYVSAMEQSRTGEIWIGDAWRSVRPLSDTSPSGAFHIQGKAEMLLDKDDNLWIAQDDEGLSRVQHISDPGKSSLTEVSGPNDLTAPQTHALLQDREGNIWVGTDRGLDQYQKTPFVHFRSTQLRYFPSLVAGDDGSVWINSHGSPLMKVVDGITIPVGAHVNTGPLAKRRNGDICFIDLTSYELQCYGPDASTHVKLPDSLEHAPPMGFVEDDDGSLLVSFQGRGFWRDSNNVWDRLNINGLPKSSPWGMLSDSRGRLWLGYGNSNIVERQNGTYRTIQIDGAWANTLTFYETGGTIWAAGSNGLCFLDGEQFRHVHTLESNLLQGTSGIVADHFGNLWLNAGAGALRISAEEVARLLKDPDHLVKVDVFDENDGLVGQPTQFKRAPSAVVDTHGTLWFATGGDVVSLDPTKLGRTGALPSVLIESVSIDGKPVLTAPGLPGAVLHTDSAHLHDLEIGYIGINLSAPERIYYRYRLVGEDQVWQEAGKRRQAFYTRLRPGSYRFQVSASSGEDWSDLAVPLRIEVNPAFYQTWWFTTLCILTGLGVAWMVFKARVRFVKEQVHSRLSERLAERERVARELHDTLLQGFQGLMMRFHLATQSIPSNEIARSEMEEALDSADLLLVESRDRIRDLRYEAIEPASLSDSLKALGEDFAMPHIWDLQVVTRGFVLDLNPISYQEIYAIAKEAVVNAFRHSNASEIRVEISFQPAKLILDISDNGMGIDSEILSGQRRANHWGLAGMRERAHNLGADLKFMVPAEEGTQIRLTVPAAVAYRYDQRASGFLRWYQRWLARLRKPA